MPGPACSRSRHENEAFALNLRETLLQDSIDLAEDSLVAEVAAQVVTELTHEAHSLLQTSGFQALLDLYRLPYGQRYLRSLGRDDGPMHELARRAFNFPLIWNQCSVMTFFVHYANDMPKFRPYILARNGLVLLSEHIKSTDDETDRYSKLLTTMIAIANLSCYGYCTPMLADWNLCPTLVKELVNNQPLILTSDNPYDSAWFSYSIIKFFRNLAFLGGVKGRKMVLGAMTDELQVIVPEIEPVIKIAMGAGSAQLVRGWIVELWPNICM